jgi:hypothetical protein
MDSNRPRAPIFPHAPRSRCRATLKNWSTPMKKAATCPCSHLRWAFAPFPPSPRTATLSPADNQPQPAVGSGNWCIGRSTSAHPTATTSDSRWLRQQCQWVQSHARRTGIIARATAQLGGYRWKVGQDLGLGVEVGYTISAISSVKNMFRPMRRRPDFEHQERAARLDARCQRQDQPRGRAGTSAATRLLYGCQGQQQQLQQQRHPGPASPMAAARTAAAGTPASAWVGTSASTSVWA